MKHTELQIVQDSVTREKITCFGDLIIGDWFLDSDLDLCLKLAGQCDLDEMRNTLIFEADQVGTMNLADSIAVEPLVAVKITYTKISK